MNSSSMNAAAGITSSSARSNGARAAAGVAVVIAGKFSSLERIDERALDRHMHADVIAPRGRDRPADVQQRAQWGDDVEQRIAPAVLDVLDLGDDDVDVAGVASD